LLCHFPDAVSYSHSGVLRGREDLIHLVIALVITEQKVGKSPSNINTDFESHIASFCGLLLLAMKVKHVKKEFLICYRWQQRSPVTFLPRKSQAHFI
jgi:hypothetical protein